MSRLSPIRIMAAATVGIVVGALFVAVLGATDQGSTPGMALPVQAGLAFVLALASAGALLLIGRSGTPVDESRTERCESCGGDVYHEWRLCPHCGVWLHQK